MAYMWVADILHPPIPPITIDVIRSEMNSCTLKTFTLSTTIIIFVPCSSLEFEFMQ
jgi:hypothetical protein